MDCQPLHKVPQYMNECAEVLNEEWKRSLTARLHSLEKSRDEFPVCLVLLDKVDSNTQVIGHSMLSVVRGQAVKSCLVESVVVPKCHRGKGYGRIVMQRTEEFAASQGFEVMYLTTHDKQKFYEHLGYNYCSPVVSIGSGILPEHLANKLIEGLNLNTQGNNTSSETSSSPKHTIGDGDSKTLHRDNTNSVTKKTNDVPAVNQAPPPAPPPCPVAPPPPPAPKVAEKLNVTRWDPSQISWMKKKIS